MCAIPDAVIRAGLELLSVAIDAAGETNDVFFCRAKYQGHPVNVYIKAAKGPRHCLANERAVLDALASGALPVPRVVGYVEAPRAVLAVEALPGRMVWEYIDPRRDLYKREEAPAYLRAYGRCLARVHNLPLAWEPQKRPRLAGLIGEENLEDSRFQEIVAWLETHAPIGREQVFVHGDLNTASVLFHDGALSGVVDWEFAGRGWREQDLAWVLRARTAFLNTPAERDALLQGYREHASYDEEALRWCEVLNYLHFAYWSREDEPEYTAYALHKARERADL